MNPIVDPRHGDVEDDVLSTKRRSMASLAGSMLVEVSPVKLVMAWLLMIGIPGFLLGLAPRVLAIWIGALSSKALYALTGFSSAIALAAVVAIGWFAGGRVFRLVETSFWTLNAIFVQPVYALCREGLRHAAERMMASDASVEARSKARSVCAALAGVAISLCALFIIIAVWPATVWIASAPTTTSPWRLLSIAFANSTVLTTAYLAIAALAWGIEDARMDQPRDLQPETSADDGARRWRIAHLSDIHNVGERYGFRIESGRSGPSGNNRLRRLLARLDEIHDAKPLDFILLTGDVTDAGRSAEWAEFFDALAEHPRIAPLFLILPGNHDVNVVDRANSARLDLPTSPKRRLREMRAISAMERLQGSRARTVDIAAGRIGQTLTEMLKPHDAALRTFADTGSIRLSWSLAEVWAGIFPLVVAPDADDGLGIILVDSNAETHFSFTNALGLVSFRQVRSIDLAVAQYPRARWIIAIHHHVVEYPSRVKAFSERIGTALVNGNWFVRSLQGIAPTSVVMHGHRHIDWIGACGALRIVSAPSPVMEAIDSQASYFYIHTFAASEANSLALLSPERIEVEGESAAPVVQSDGHRRPRTQ